MSATQAKASSTTSTKTSTKEAELERIFDEGKVSMTDYADMSTLHHPNREHDSQRTLSVQMPEWLITVLDGEASRLGISRQAVMKVWLAERADKLAGA